MKPTKRSAEEVLARTEEAREFEATEMPYGHYNGNSIGSVPTDYLLAITEPKKDDPFKKALRGYVASDRFRRMQDG